MKAKFNFLQFANWVYISYINLLNLENEKIEKKQLIERLKIEKRKISSLKDILNKKVVLHGISRDFLKNLPQIKKEYGIEE